MRAFPSVGVRKAGKKVGFERERGPVGGARDGTEKRTHSQHRERERERERERARARERESGRV